MQGGNAHSKRTQMRDWVPSRQILSPETVQADLLAPLANYHRSCSFYGALPETFSLLLGVVTDLVF